MLVVQHVVQVLGTHSQVHNLYNSYRSKNQVLLFQFDKLDTNQDLKAQKWYDIIPHWVS
jgi:hypothetical protein